VTYIWRLLDAQTGSVSSTWFTALTASGAWNWVTAMLAQILRYYFLKKYVLVKLNIQFSKWQIAVSKRSTA
jgi:hypothetical protein